EFLKEIGRDMNDCGRTTPLQAFLRPLQLSRWNPSVQAERAESLGRTQPWIIAHLQEPTENDFDPLAKIPHKFLIVHWPRSHADLGRSDFQFEKLRELGFNICLGADSLASNDDLSLFAEMRIFHDRFRVQPRKVLEMVTINPACALEQRDRLGKICVNFLADM